MRGIRYTPIPIVSVEGIHDVYLRQGSMNGDDFVQSPILQPFNGLHPHSVVILDNASIHHVDRVRDLLKHKLEVGYFLPPYSPDLNPTEGVFSQVKSIMRR